MRISRHFLAGCAAVIATLGGAQGLARWHGAPLGHGDSWYGACGHDAGRNLARTLPELEGMLAITPAQRGAWDAFAASLGDADQHRREACHSAATPGAAPEMLADLVRVVDIMLRGLRGIESPLAELYAALTHTQRQRLDALFAERMWR